MNISQDLVPDADIQTLLRDGYKLKTVGGKTEFPWIDDNGRLTGEVVTNLVSPQGDRKIFVVRTLSQGEISNLPGFIDGAIPRWDWIGMFPPHKAQ